MSEPHYLKPNAGRFMIAFSNTWSTTAWMSQPHALALLASTSIKFTKIITQRGGIYQASMNLRSTMTTQKSDSRTFWKSGQAPILLSTSSWIKNLPWEKGKCWDANISIHVFEASMLRELRTPFMLRGNWMIRSIKKRLGYFSLGH